MKAQDDDNFAAVLSWKDITVSTIPKGQNLARTILTNAHGCVNPGEFLAVMGPSGAGKTTLLNSLSNRRQKALRVESGTILLNNCPIGQVDYSSMIGFVPQDDILFTSMSPREILEFTAALTQNLSQKAIKQLVEETIKDLGLNACADTLVGGMMNRGLSGGEKKRTSVGMELICNPCVLFLDEPTTGLDSFTALSIVQLIVNIAKTFRRTIIATIHQPSSQIFQCFDKLMLLSQGMTVYTGKAANAVGFFNDLGYQLPDNYNPADHFLSVISENKFKIPEFNHNYSVLDSVNYKQKVVYSAPFFKALYWLLWRAYLDMLRNPLNIAGKVFKVVIFSLMCLAVFWELGYDEQGIYDRESCIFVIVCSLAMESHLSTLQTFQMQKLVFIREYNQNRYGAFVYFLSYNLITFPIELIWDLSFALIIYYAVDLNTDRDSMLKFLLACVLSGMMGTGWGMLISIVGSTLESAAVFSMIVLVPLWLCGGFLINYADIPDWFVLKYISPYYFTFQTAIRPQLDTLEGTGGYGNVALGYLNLPNSYNEGVAYALLVIFLFRLTNYLLLKYIYKFH